MGLARKVQILVISERKIQDIERMWVWREESKMLLGGELGKQ